MEADGVLEFAVAEEGEDALAVAELALEVVVDLVAEFRRDVALAVVVPIRVDPNQQMRFLPIDRVSLADGNGPCPPLAQL
jgi:hypothetical protein